ncbi:MAG: autotransporter outer membrane beta-barrel domain-containing protein [Phascolarctobacterium sp.]|nr:autotransporter outer membrane beta-barrel domain-containing protein [Phascolarctobacterium sp.]
MSKKIMKRSLALGALMAFVITGSAFAEVIEKEATKWDGSKYYYHTLQGTEDVVAASKTKNDGVLGGYYIADGKAVDGKLNSSVVVDGGDWNLIVGGDYVKSGKSNKDGINLNVQSTKVIVNNGNIHQLAGGTGGTDNWKLTYEGADSSTLIINGGTFGETKVAGNCPELLVTGGDLLKDGSGDNPNYNLGATSSIKNVSTTINNGTFNAAIIGGSSAIQYYGTTGSTLSKPCDQRIGLNTSVENATTTINGGTFNHAIVAGGFAYGWHTNSTVENTVLNINGNTGNKLTVNGDVYAGAIRGNVNYERFQTDGVNKLTTIATVGKAEVNISDAIVGNVYGTGAFIKQPGGNNTDWVYSQDADAIVDTTLKLTNVTAQNVIIPKGEVTLRTEGSENIDENRVIINGQTGLNVGDSNNQVAVKVEADGDANDAFAGDYKELIKDRFKVNGYNLYTEDSTGEVSSVNVEAVIEEGEVAGKTVVDSQGNATTYANQGNTGIKDIVATGLISWRYEMNDMNKRMGELRNANGEHGVWVRMVRGETEYNSVKNQYNQYQLGYDEKLSVDPSWTVGVALSYTEADNNFSKGTGESTNKALSIYGSKLNDDGTFIDLIAKYARLENDFDLGTAKGDYDTNGYSFSAEYGKRIQQGNGLWIEPQVELTYGQVDGATYMVGGRTVNQDNMESLIGRVGFSLGKDISKGNVYARASYLYDFEGETSATFSKGIATDSFEQDLGGGWWEVGVGANINLSKATYIYADIEKTFGGEVDTNWQWNMGVRYSF